MSYNGPLRIYQIYITISKAKYPLKANNMRSFEEKIGAEITAELAQKRKINEKGEEFSKQLEALFNSPEIDKDEIRDIISQYKRFLLKLCGKENAEEILSKYYKKLEKS